MSDSLDRLFRDRQPGVPPTSPPAGQWERIVRRQLVVDPGNKRRLPVGLLVLGLLLGLGMGVPAGAYFFSTQCPVISASDNTFASSRANKTTVSNATAPAKTISSTSIAPAAAPKESASIVPEILKERDNRLATDEANNESAIHHDHSVRPLEHNFPEADAPLPAPNGIADVTENSLLKPSLMPAAKLPSFPNEDVRSGRFGLLHRTLTKAANRAPTESIKIEKRKPSSPVRWEFGLHVTPWRSDAATAVRTYSETDNGLGFSPRTFEFDGQEILLYPATTLNPDLDRRFQLKVVSFEIARQFHNGLRFGFGVAWTPRHVGGFLNDRSYLNAQLAPGEWASSHTIERQTVYGSAQIDYTFMRRRRFRPYLGISLRTFLYGDFNVQEYLFDRESGRSEVTNSINVVSRIDLNSLEIFPRGGFQYDLSSRFSIGVEIVPGVGIGGRWKL